MGKGLDICVIGAGISGLAAARTFQARGHRVTILERGQDIGGVWEPSRSYPDVKTQTPRDLYAFSDQPMPKSYPEWPSGAEVFAYLRDHVSSDIASAHIVINGSSVIVCEGEELVDVLRRPGQGVLNILAVADVKDDVDAQLVPLGETPPDTGSPTNGSRRAI